jgi:hypothetical protein
MIRMSWYGSVWIGMDLYRSTWIYGFVFQSAVDHSRWLRMDMRHSSYTVSLSLAGRVQIMKD